MSLVKRVTDQFVYIQYSRDDYKDVVLFKRELENVAAAGAGGKDVVVDFSNAEVLTSSEIGLLVRLINSFKGTARYVRIVASEKIKNSLIATNIHTLENIMIYKNKNEFVEQLKKLAGQANNTN